MNKQGMETGGRENRMMTCERLVLRFPHHLVNRPIICELVRQHDLEFNILKASVTPREEGLLVVELQGEDDTYKEGIRFLTGAGVEVQPLSQDIVRNDTACIHCGACVAICPTGALAIDGLTRRVHFHDNKCIACELCVPACPPGAMEIHF